jgi:hypothetical protein
MRTGTRRGWIYAATALAVAALAAAATGAYGLASGSSPTAGSGRHSAPVLAPIHGKYAPKIRPANFVRKIDNPYWPLKPGTTFHYRGVRDKTPQTDNETVTHKTKKILGIDSVVVADTVSQHGAPIERTSDWYAQDRWGNVWYMGELALEKKHGHFVKASDSWKSGVNGGKPGIIMPGHPRPGDAYRQEYYPPGKALDEAHVLSLHGTATVPYGGRHAGLLVTSEYSPLEPQTEQKYYDPGTGELMEKVVKGHHEAFRLVGITH